MVQPVGHSKRLYYMAVRIIAAVAPRWRGKNAASEYGDNRKQYEQKFTEQFTAMFSGGYFHDNYC